MPLVVKYSDMLHRLGQNQKIRHAKRIHVRPLGGPLRRLKEERLFPSDGCFSSTNKFFRLFMGTSSVHGMKYLLPSKHAHPIERVAWFGAVLLALSGSLFLSMTTLRRFNENPTVVSMEHNYKEWNTSFPSVTICPTAKYNHERVIKLVEAEYPEAKDKLALAEFIKTLANSTFGKFSGIMSHDGTELNPSKYWNAVWKISFPFFYNVSNSNVESYNQVEMNEVFTEIGICYSYNSATTFYNDPKKWERNAREYLGKIKIFEGSPLDGDIFAQVMNMNSGYGLYLLDPAEFPDIAIPQIQGGNNSYKTLDLTAVSIVSSRAAEGLRVQQRKCRFPHESNLDTSSVYSYNLCRMECRMKATFERCKCVPFFYRPTNYPVCGPEGMMCLDKYSEILIKMLNPDTGEKVPCDCLQLCNEVNYVIDTDNTMEWTLGTNLKWGLIKYPKFRLKRDIIFGWTDLLVSIGGTAGLFLGCSLLSFAEIVYFFTLRLFWFAWRRNITERTGDLRDQLKDY